MDCIAACAPHSDVQIQFRDLAAYFARGLPLNSRPLQTEGAGNAGRPMRPIAACAMSSEMRTRVSQVTPESPGIPRAMALRLMSYPPRRSAFLPPSSAEIASRKLDASVEASGPYDFAVRRKALSSPALPRPPHPVPRFVTLRNAPLFGPGWRDRELICHFGKPEYFCKKGLTEGPINRPGDLPVGQGACRLILMLRDVSSESFRFAPYKRLSNGQIGVDANSFVPLAAFSSVIVIAGLCCLFL